MEILQSDLADWMQQLQPDNPPLANMARRRMAELELAIWHGLVESGPLLMPLVTGG